MKLLAKYDESWIYGMCVREKHWGEIVLLLPFHWRGQNFFLKINWYINMSIISFLSWFKIIWNYISYVILVNSKLLSLLVHFTVTGFETEAVNHLKQTLRLNLLVLRNIHGKNVPSHQNWVVWGFLFFLIFPFIFSGEAARLSLAEGGVSECVSVSAYWWVLLS